MRGAFRGSRGGRGWGTRGNRSRGRLYWVQHHILQHCHELNILKSTTHWIAGDVPLTGLLPSAENVMFFLPLYVWSTFVTDHGCVQGKTTTIFLDALSAVLTSFQNSLIIRLHLVNLAFKHLDNLLLRTESKEKFSLARDLVKPITFERLLIFLPILSQFFAQHMEKSNDQS